jgi:hypothetical protein
VVGPKPWRCETVKQDFKEDGVWLYTMIGPNGEKAGYSRAKYGEIMEHRSFDWMSAFCDENGNVMKMLRNQNGCLVLPVWKKGQK